MTPVRLLFAAVAVALPCALAAVAVPNTFGTGQVANAAHVNENFTTLATAVTKLETVVAFQAASPATPFNIPNATATNITGWTEVFDSGAAFDPATGAFTAPVDGYYQFNASILFNNGAINSDYCNFKKSFASGGLTHYANFSGINRQALGSSVTMKLATGDAVVVECYQAMGSAQVLANLTNHNAFSGFLIGRY